MHVRVVSTACSLLLAAATACENEPLFVDTTRSLTGVGGSAGAATGAAGSEPGLVVPNESGGAGPVGGGPGVSAACVSNAECDDQNACTQDVCVPDRGCVTINVAPGRSCGDSNGSECSQPDTCDGLGSCDTNHTAAGVACPGSACTTPGICDGRGECQVESEAEVTADPAADGSACAEGVCIAGVCGCFSAAIDAVPYAEDWQIRRGDFNFADFECENGCTRVPDHVVVFTAPSSDRFRFTATSSADPVMAVFDGRCSTQTELECNDDTRGGNPVIVLGLTEGDVVTVVVSEQCEADGGAGTLSIDVVSD